MIFTYYVFCAIRIASLSAGERRRDTLCLISHQGVDRRVCMSCCDITIYYYYHPQWLVEYVNTVLLTSDSLTNEKLNFNQNTNINVIETIIIDYHNIMMNDKIIGCWLIFIRSQACCSILAIQCEYFVATMSYNCIQIVFIKNIVWILFLCSSSFVWHFKLVYGYI